MARPGDDPLGQRLSCSCTYPYEDTGTPSQLLDVTEFLVGYLGALMRITPTGKPNQPLLFDDGEYNEINGRCGNQQRLGGRRCVRKQPCPGEVIRDPTAVSLGLLLVLLGLRASWWIPPDAVTPGKAVYFRAQALGCCSPGM